MKAPLIDERDSETILRQLRDLVPHYTPEWKADDDRDPGVAVMKLFAGMYRGIIQRLNQVPEKHYLAYLDMLGVKRLPARPARVPLTFHLSTGASEPVLIAARTGAAAPDKEGGKPIPFETERAIVATPAKLVEAIAVDPAADRIVRAPGGFLDGPIASFSTTLTADTGVSGGRLLLASADGLKPGDVLLVTATSSEYVEIAAVKGFEVTPAAPVGSFPAGAAVTRVTGFELWEGRNLQEHALYLGHSELFRLRSPAAIELRFEGSGQSGDVLAQRYGRLVRWAYATEEGGWKPFQQEASGGCLVLRMTGQDALGELTVDGKRSRWIRGTYVGGADSLAGLRIRSVAATIVHEGAAAELAFANDVPIDATVGTSFYPFGEAPKLYDTLYLAHDETLSKRGGKTAIAFKLEHELSEGMTDKSTTARLSWEYWNGGGWMRLPGVTEHFKAGDESVVQREVEFNVPDDLSETIVLGQQRRWIRIRIVSGDFGREELLRQDDSAYRLVPRYVLPRLSNLTFQSRMPAATATNVQHAIALNQLTYVDYGSALRSGQAVEPFALPDAPQPALYLGFDSPPYKGPISLYFAMAEQAYGEDARPRLVWEYYRSQGGRSGWTRLDVLDDTEHLTRSGCLAFVGPDDLAPAFLFGRRLYWLRALDTESRFVPSSRRRMQLEDVIEASEATLTDEDAEAASASEDCGCGCGCDAAPCDEEVQWFGTSLNDAVPGYAPAPKLHGIYRNTTIAVQAESVRNETLGSSRGTAGLTFVISKSPVLAEEVEVDEASALSEGERKEIRENGALAYRETIGEDGETTAFWVRWSRTEDLSSSSPEDRHYELDPTTGTLAFGDGIRGRIPPSGIDNIRCSYQAGGGSRGNVARGELSMLRTSIAYVDRISNPAPSEGGFDTEPLERIVERGPERVRHRGRAVTAKDYEELASEAAQGLAKVKCLAGINDKSEAESGWISVVIVPQGASDRPLPSLGLKRQVLGYLRERASAVATAPGRLRVTGPAYIEVTVTATIVAVSFDSVPLLEREAARRIKAYLHPLTGGIDGRGWPFGTLPALSDFYALLEGLPYADHVERLSMTLRDEGSGRTLDISPEHPADVRALPQSLVCAGEPAIAIKPPSG